MHFNGFMIHPKPQNNVHCKCDSSAPPIRGVALKPLNDTASPIYGEGRGVATSDHPPKTWAGLDCTRHLEHEFKNTLVVIARSGGVGPTNGGICAAVLPVLHRTFSSVPKVLTKTCWPMGRPSTCASDGNANRSHLTS